VGVVGDFANGPGAGVVAKLEVDDKNLEDPLAKGKGLGCEEAVGVEEQRWMLWPGAAKEEGKLEEKRKADGGLPTDEIDVARSGSHVGECLGEL